METTQLHFAGGSNQAGAFQSARNAGDTGCLASTSATSVAGWNSTLKKLTYEIDLKRGGAVAVGYSGRYRLDGGPR